MISEEEIMNAWMMPILGCDRGNTPLEGRIVGILNLEIKSYYQPVIY
jgi:hypothetical protein